MKSLLMIVMGVLASGTIFAETFSWRHTEGYTANKFNSPSWKSFGDGANWAVGHAIGGDQIPSGADVIWMPSDTGNSWADYTASMHCFDLGGQNFEVGSLGNGKRWSARHILLRNGTLAFLNSFTNYFARIHVFDGGKFVLGPDCAACGGQSTSFNSFNVLSGGALEIGGDYNVVFMKMTINSGAEATLNPDRFAFDAAAVGSVSFVRNSGTLNMPSGLVLSGSSNQSTSKHKILIEQIGGTLNVGGSIVNNATYGSVDFVFSGGTINAIGDVGFEKLGTVMMTNDAVATVNVAAGKTLDLTKMVFRSGTALTKTGEGAVKFGASVPETLNIAEGVVEPTSPVEFNTIAFGGGILRLVVPGVSLCEVQGAENAVIVVTDAILNPNVPVLKIEGETAAGIISQKLSAPEGFSWVENGGVLTMEKMREGSREFVWKRKVVGGYGSFYDSNCWGIGKVVESENPEGLIPGENDYIYIGTISGEYHRYFKFDMGGAVRWVKGISGGLEDPTWGFSHINISNGTLGFLSSFTNMRAVVTVENSGRLVLGENCSMQMGSGGAQNSYTVQNGGECIIGGNAYMQIMHATVEAGGKFVFRPTVFNYDNRVNSDNSQSYLRNSGTLEIPNGFTLGGASKGGCTFTVEQRGGEMVLGGDIVMADAVDYLDFKLSNGTVRVANDAAFIGCRTVAMLGAGSAAVDVADGKTADFSTMTFEADTSVVKTGLGSLKLGASVPASLSVEAGRLIIGAAADYGSALTLGEGATLHFAAAGASFASLAGLNAASVTFDESALKPGAVLFTTSDAELAAAMAAKILPLVESFSGDRRTLVAVEDGNGRTAFKVVSKRGLKVIVK